MPTKLHKHFNLIGIGLYLLSLIIVSLVFRHYALKPLWMAWGIGTVLLFFGCTFYCYRAWRNNEAQSFQKKVFWTALAIRVVYVVGIYFYYTAQTGISFEYGAADSIHYHNTAQYLLELYRNDSLATVFNYLNDNTMGFSDQGYLLYLTTIYAILGKSTLTVRLLKALMSATMVVSIYRLTERNLGSRTAKLAAVMTVFLPHFIHYNGTYFKETEMLFVATLALERFDYLIRNKKNRVLNLLLCVLLTAMTFGFRTGLGMILLGSYIMATLCLGNDILPKKTKVLVLVAVAVTTILFLLTPIGKEMTIMVKVNLTESDYLVEKYQRAGMDYAEYASYKTMAPGAFVMPLTNLVEVANDNQKMMNGTYFIKNYLAFFAMWCIIVCFREKKWRNFSLIATYTIAYVLMIAFSFAFSSERYHLPAMPGILIMAAVAMTHFRKKDFAYFYSYQGLLLLAIVAWNYLKLAARGLIF